MGRCHVSAAELARCQGSKRLPREKWKFAAKARLGRILMEGMCSQCSWLLLVFGGSAADAATPPENRYIQMLSYDDRVLDFGHSPLPLGKVFCGNRPLEKAG